MNAWPFRASVQMTNEYVKNITCKNKKVDITAV